MAATYSGDPSASDRDWVRFVVQDTDTSNADLQDAEIDAMLSTKSNVVEAAVACQEVICKRHILAAMRASEPWNLIDSIRGFCAQAIQNIRRQFGATGNVKVVTPYQPWTSVTAKEDMEDDSDRVAPRFQREQHDFVTRPETGEVD